MNKIIEYLELNPTVVNLLQHGKVSLVGISAEESTAITEMYGMKENADTSTRGNGYWRDV
ncbi:competence pheromone ComX [Lysinibacillus sp. 54212]|uniref:competence pheromone ComX n=1 Tax=Lysinibacillus sp. 54212 TaxID=3119829 RepID=UPI002FC649C8